MAIFISENNFSSNMWADEAMHELIFVEMVLFVKIYLSRMQGLHGGINGRLARFCSIWKN